MAEYPLSECAVTTETTLPEEKYWKAIEAGQTYVFTETADRLDEEDALL